MTDSEELSRMEACVKSLILYVGEEPMRKGLQKTPARVLRALLEMTQGYRAREEDIYTIFENDMDYDSIILLKDIEFYSMCEHHMLPFFGTAHIAYLPDKKIIGISKLARLLDMYSKRLQIQERIGQQITESLMKNLQALGAACIINAKHLCVCSRGVSKQHSMMITSSLAGVFRTGNKAHLELLQLIQL